MVATRINGTALADAVRMGVKRSVATLHTREIDPCLATILVGDNYASATYVRNKHKACAEVGILTMDKRLRQDVTQEQLEGVIGALNSDANVHGILLQLPLPDHLDAFAAISKISRAKDVDGLTPQNVGLLSVGRARLMPCTPLGIMAILDHHKIELAGKTAVLINRSNLIGKPMQQLLLQRDATVITCHSKTRNLQDLCMLADVVITAVGNRAAFELGPGMLREGCTVIDAAIATHRGKLVGDARYEDIIPKAAFITPVPGGVGPMTIAMLLKNTVTAAADIHGIAP